MELPRECVQLWNALIHAQAAPTWLCAGFELTTGHLMLCHRSPCEVSQVQLSSTHPKALFLRWN